MSTFNSFIFGNKMQVVMATGHLVGSKLSPNSGGLTQTDCNHSRIGEGLQIISFQFNKCRQFGNILLFVHLFVTGDSTPLVANWFYSDHILI